MDGYLSDTFLSLSKGLPAHCLKVNLYIVKVNEYCMCNEIVSSLPQTFEVAGKRKTVGRFITLTQPSVCMPGALISLDVFSLRLLLS